MVERTWTDGELEASLRRSFVDKGYPAIEWDGHEARNPFLSDGVSLGLRNGWLEQGPLEEGEQWTRTSYHLTPKGKEYFGISA